MRLGSAQFPFDDYPLLRLSVTALMPLSDDLSGEVVERIINRAEGLGLIPLAQSRSPITRVEGQAVIKDAQGQKQIKM